MLLSCQVPNTQPSDFDFFMVVPSFTAQGHARADHLRKLRADELVLQTLEALKEVASAQQDCFAIFTPTCVTWLLDHENGKTKDIFSGESKEVLKIQIITRLYETPAQVWENHHQPNLC